MCCPSVSNDNDKEEYENQLHYNDFKSSISKKECDSKDFTEVIRYIIEIEKILNQYSFS
jgi:hypothetical protein